MKVKVNAGYQLGPDDGSKLYYEGDTFDVPDALAQAWIAGGQAVAVKADTPKKAKAVKASKNKAVTASPNKGFVGTIPSTVPSTTPVHVSGVSAPAPTIKKG